MAEKNTFIPFSIKNLQEAGDFARACFWEISFPDAPDPFKVWFPATDLDEGIFAVESTPVEFFNISIQYPKKLTLPKITLTLYDRDDRINFKWIRHWIYNTMFRMNIAGSFPCVEVLENVVKEMKIAKLNYAKKIVDLVSYWVYPESINDRGTSGDELTIYSIPFVVAGISQV